MSWFKNISMKLKIHLIAGTAIVAFLFYFSFSFIVTETNTNSLQQVKNVSLEILGRVDKGIKQLNLLKGLFQYAVTTAEADTLDEV